MRKTTFKIRRRVIQAFAFSLLCVLVFAVFSFRVHREIGYRLRLLELTSDLLYNILEVRRFEKNFFLYKEPDSLREAMSYVERVKVLYNSHKAEILSLKAGPQTPAFYRTLLSYEKALEEMRSRWKTSASGLSAPDLSRMEDSLRNLGQELLTMTESWEK